MLLLDKPDGPSSNQALQQAKRLLNARKAGHTGSLDPIATGLLPLCFGEATKIAGLFLDADKSYWVRIRLGAVTDTGDRAGRVLDNAEQGEHGLSGSGADVSAQKLHRALERFRGEFEQIPPMYSAVKHNGQPLYKLARANISVQRAPRAVTVYALAVEKHAGDLLELSLSCSRGFYIRALATDLGEVLGCGAHVLELRRTTVGDFSLDNAISLARLEAIESPEARRKHLLPVDQALTHLPKINLPACVVARLRQGKPAQTTSAPASGLLRIYTEDGEFLGLADSAGNGKITAKRLFHPH